MIEKTQDSIQINLEEHNKKFKDMTPEEIILWGYKNYNNHFAITTSFGIQSSVILHMVNKCSLQKKIKKFDLKSSWAVCQFESDYNPIHWHDGHLSGVMYTKMPKDLGSSYKDQNKNGKIAFIHGSTQLLVSSVYDVKPEVGDLFIFPSYMMHTVYPFFSDEERRSVSFNAFLDEEAAKF